MTGLALLAHSGGPTRVINASLLGVVEATRAHNGRLWGSRFGVQGILQEDFIDLQSQSADTLAAVGRAPSSALGTSRHELNEPDIERILSVFRKHEIRCFYYTGGNGSMGTASQISKLARDAGYELQVIGIPKTIDNDITETDHTPGYGSAARFFACAARDIGADNEALPGQVEFLEVLGRNAGWLVAATVLAQRDTNDPPHLIYFPEAPLPLSQLLADIDRVYSRLGRCVVAVCEGQLDENGNAFGADTRKGSRGSLAMNLGHRLAMLTSEHLGLRARSEKPGLLGRSSEAFLSETDWAESKLCGEAAVAGAHAGESGKMISLVREAGTNYQISTKLAPLERVAFIERLFPEEWRTPAGLAGFRAFAEPLTGPLTGASRLSF